MNAIRCLDYTFSLFGMIVLSPVLLVVAIIIKATSEGPVFYRQTRVGKDGEDFQLYKFRTMRVNADKQGLLTVGGRDSRVTAIGYFLRKYKLDELPQLINVLKGEMSLVGPRPEVRKYVSLYNRDQLKVLSVKPGITDLASIVYRNENELLASAADPEKFYINEIMPRKIALNFSYIENRTVANYFKIILRTVVTAVRGK